MGGSLWVGGLHSRVDGQGAAFFFFFLELLPQILFAPYPLRPFSFPRGKFSCFQSGLGGEGWEVRDVLAATILKTQLGRRLRISLFSVQNLI